jgi:hypothetical protein
VSGRACAEEGKKKGAVVLDKKKEEGAVGTASGTVTEQATSDKFARATSMMDVITPLFTLLGQMLRSLVTVRPHRTTMARNMSGVSARRNRSVSSIDHGRRH